MFNQDELMIIKSIMNASSYKGEDVPMISDLMKKIDKKIDALIKKN